MRQAGYTLTVFVCVVLSGYIALTPEEKVNTPEKAIHAVHWMFRPSLEELCQKECRLLFGDERWGDLIEEGCTCKRFFVRRGTNYDGRLSNGMALDRAPLAENPGPRVGPTPGS